MTAEIKINLEKTDLEKCIRRYHFEDGDLDSLRALSRAMQPLVQAKAWYQWGSRTIPLPAQEWAVAFLTLGEGVDRMQELYLDRECVSEAYMIECLSMELLTKAYEEFVRQLQRETGRWARRLVFLGEDYPLELLPGLHGELAPMDISYNEQLMLTPKKSVVLLIPVSVSQTAEGERQNPCHVCGGCGNVECIFRAVPQTDREKDRQPGHHRQQDTIQAAHTYGYQRIFGGREV